ncbi:hypothetical protein [Micromonospora taraxaci]|uniref:hypothetical protein n=1 Tax=Micromonospora taraxaci TaxID=1316803 RepID=UPI0033B0E970
MLAVPVSRQRVQVRPDRAGEAVAVRHVAVDRPGHRAADARADTDLARVTPHTLRKTVATLIKEETDTKSAAQLGHSSEEVTATYYIAKPAQAPDVSDILERLGTDHGKRPSPPPAVPNDAHG